MPDDVQLPIEDRLFLEFRETGSEMVFTQLVLMIEPWILRIIIVQVRDLAIAKDVLQTTWLQMLRTKDRFDPERGSFKGLFYRIAINESRHAYRHTSRTQSFPQDDDGVMIEPPAPQLPPVCAEIKEALERLRRQHREVIELHYYGGFEVHDIAHMLGVPEGTVKTWLFRARSKLAKLLAVVGPIITLAHAVRAAGFTS